jgi:hypothetical protein
VSLVNVVYAVYVVNIRPSFERPGGIWIRVGCEGGIMSGYHEHRHELMVRFI